MGFALAQSALDRGATVILITAPAALPTPVGAERVEVETAEDMRRAVMEALPASDILAMAAAVADFRPVTFTPQKIKKGAESIALTLERTADILEEVSAWRQAHGRPALLIGFAAETENLLENARAKLQRKQLDLIVANDITAPESGFAVDTNRVTLIARDGTEETLPLLNKEEVAAHVWDRAAEMLWEG